MTPWDEVTEEQIKLAKAAQASKEEESKEKGNELRYNADYLATTGTFQNQLSDRISHKPIAYQYPKYSTIEARKDAISKKELGIESWGSEYRFQCLTGEEQEYKIHPFSKRVIELAGTDERFFIPMLSRF